MVRLKLLNHDFLAVPNAKIMLEMHQKSTKIRLKSLNRAILAVLGTTHLPEKHLFFGIVRLKLLNRDFLAVPNAKNYGTNAPEKHKNTAKKFKTRVFSRTEYEKLRDKR